MVETSAQNGYYGLHLMAASSTERLAKLQRCRERLAAGAERG